MKWCNQLWANYIDCLVIAYWLPVDYISTCIFVFFAGDPWQASPGSASPTPEAAAAKPVWSLVSWAKEYGISAKQEKTYTSTYMLIYKYIVYKYSPQTLAKEVLTALYYGLAGCGGFPTAAAEHPSL